MNIGDRLDGLFSGTPEKPWPDAVVHHGARAVLLLALAAGLVAVFPADPGIEIGRHEAGTVAERDVIADHGFDVPKDPEVLMRERAAAAAAVLPTFVYREEAAETARGAVAAFFAAVDSAGAESAMAGIASLLDGAGIEAEPEQMQLLGDRAEAARLRDGALDAIDILAARGVLTPGAASEADRDSVRVARGDSSRVVARGSLLSVREFYDAAAQGWEPGPAADLLRLVLARHMAPNLEPDGRRNADARAAARDSVPGHDIQVRRGLAIVRANDPVDETEIRMLNAYRASLEARGISVDQSNLGAAAGGLLLNCLLLGILGALAFFFRPDIYLAFRSVLGLAVIAALYFAGARMAADMAKLEALSLSFPGAAVPSVFAAVIISILWDGRLALLTVLVLCALTGAQQPFASVEAYLVALAGGSAAAFAMRDFRRMSQVWKLIAIAAGAYLAALAGVRLQGADFAFLPALVWAVGAAVAWAILGVGFLPVFERLTGVTSDHTLIGLADHNQKLISRLSAVAPGTFAHTVQVANLAEAGAKAIGANAHLCRTGAYYHDVGKTTQPHLFIENQRGKNPHDDMNPAKSAAIVRSHVLDGANLARKAKVPRAVIDFIMEHHGDQTIGFLLRKARDRAKAKGEPPPDPALFRYPGPRPRSRETAVVMLADSVESAARALKDPTAERIARLIDGIFENKRDHGQLDDASLTLQDLAALRAQFLNMLSGIHHRRIDYPATRHLTDAPGSAPP